MTAPDPTAGERECSQCGAPWMPVRRGECVRCGSDAGPASAGTSEDVDRAAVDEILALFPMDEHGTGHIADCGYDANDERCDCYTLPERMAAVLAAREAAARAEALREAADAFGHMWQADAIPSASIVYRALRDRAARIAREAR